MDENCVCKVRASLKVELHPSKLHCVKDGVREHMNNLLFKYQEDLEGYVMAFQRVQIQRHNANIHPYFPYVHINVNAEILLFKPTVGCMLVGQVTKAATDFIGLLVLGVFNATIATDNIRPEFKCSNVKNAWISRKAPDHAIGLGSDVRFQVVKLQDRAAFFGIHGSLVEKCTGSVEALKAAGLLHKGPKGVEASVTRPEVLLEKLKQKRCRDEKVSLMRTDCKDKAENFLEGDEKKKRKKKRLKAETQS